MEAVCEKHLSLSGSLTVQTVADWRARLLDHLASAGGICLEASSVEEADTCGVQLLLSARRTAAAAGVQFEVCRPSQPLQTALAAAAIAIDHHLSPLK